MSDREPQAPRKIVVPGPPRARPVADDAEFEGLVSPQDLGSASRSCLAIIVILLIIGLLLCVFVIGAIVT